MASIMKYIFIFVIIEAVSAAAFTWYTHKSAIAECVWIGDTMICQHDAALNEIERSYLKPTCPKYGGYCI